MIKTICFDLGGEKELYLTIEEIVKLQAAFRFLCVDKYGPPDVIQKAAAAATREHEEQLRCSNAFNPPQMSNPFPHPDMAKLGDIRYGDKDPYGNGCR